MSGHNYGYARVSTPDQDPALQVDALRAAGCERIFVEKASGRAARRPELELLMNCLLPGDTLTVWKLDRLGRRLVELLELVERLEARQVAFCSVTESIDGRTPQGRLMLRVFGMVAELERDLIVERTHAGLAAARARGRVGGRRPALSAEQIAAARDLHAAGGHTVAGLARMFKVSDRTMYRALDRVGQTA